MDIKEIQKLKEKLDEEYRKDLEAINRVKNLLTKDSDNQPANVSSNQSNASEDSTKVQQDLPVDGEGKSFNQDEIPEPITPNRKRKPSGVRGAIVSIYKFLPTSYTKKDAIELVKQHKPKYANKLTSDAVTGGMKALVKDGLAVVEEEASGRSPVKYRKTMD